MAVLMLNDCFTLARLTSLCIHTLFRHPSLHPCRPLYSSLGTSSPVDRVVRSHDLLYACLPFLDRGESVPRLYSGPMTSLKTSSLEWEIKYRPEASYNTHNHPPSQSPTAHPSHRHLSKEAQDTAQNLLLAGK